MFILKMLGCIYKYLSKNSQQKRQASIFLKLYFFAEEFYQNYLKIRTR